MPNKPLGPVMLDIAGIELQVEEKEILQHPQVGGLILFTRNFESSNQLKDLVRCIREARPEIVVAVDHEGGRVQRFRETFTVLPPMQNIIRGFDSDIDGASTCARELAWVMAAELIAHDIDISFAPVLDLDDDRSVIIGDRSFSPDPKLATALAGAFIDGMHDAGMAATGKHFPGHGGVVADSHLELPVDSRGMEALEAHDLQPFQVLKEKLDALMSAHIVFPNITEELVSFSSFWLRDYLRDAMGFNGIVFSDDLSMEGAAGAGTYAQRATCALDAGCDVVLVCNKPQQAIEVIEHLELNSSKPLVRSLAQLSRRQQWTLGALNLSPRWQEAQALIEKIR